MPSFTPQPKKTRASLSIKTQQKILTEFNHLCAICGNPKPQIHHIDKNPSNNEELNLIPLCPNHHLIDAHSPTQPIHPQKLRLFRKYRDPAVLLPQFEPIFKRMLFILDSDATKLGASGIRQHSLDLLEFISCFKMGEYYANKLKPHLIWNPPERNNSTAAHQQPTSWIQQMIREMNEHPHRESAFIERFERDREMTAELIIEMLRYQEWKKIDVFI